MSDPQPKSDQSGVGTVVAIMLSSVISKGLFGKHNHKRNSGNEIVLGPETTDFVAAAVTVQLGRPAAKRSPGSLHDTQCLPQGY